MKRSMVGMVLLLSVLPLMGADPAGPPPRQLRARALEGMLQSQGDAALQTFVEQHVAPAYRDSFPPGGLFASLRALRDAAGDFGGILHEPVGADGLRVTLLEAGRETRILFRIEPDPPHRIVALTLEGTQARSEPREQEAPWTWETLEARLDAEAASGFSGTVLVVRQGRIVLHRGYGFADRERKIPNGTGTIFAIGSVPIDFTKAAILKLEEMGKLRASDPVARFIGDVPADRRTLTIDHLMRGASGLPDFHHIMGVDEDPDLSFIDRATAIRRILAQPLLFPPGEGEAHSHSAWVLLAAIVEIASGRPYGEFLRTHFFEPAGMTRTGLHEDAAAFPDDQFAIGYEGRPAGKVNIPKHWGPTSWLVMGSGGMQSNPIDLHRWIQAIRSGRTLSPAMAARYWSHGVLAGGDDRGFLCTYTEGPEDFFILSSNAHSLRGDRASAVSEELARLVSEGSRPPFTLGIEMQVEAEGEITVHRLVPGGAAERDGLRKGDRLLAAGGRPLTDPAVLRSLLAAGQPIELEIERDGRRMTISVTPARITSPSH